MDPSVRPGRSDDLEPIVAIYNHYVLSSAATFEIEPVTAGQRRDWFEAHTGPGTHRIWVATSPEGTVLGWATTSAFRPRPSYSTTVEASVYCDPTVLGRGVGSCLYDTLLRSLEHDDVERVVAGVTLPNPASLALHRKFGFRPVGTFTRVGRKFGQYWDVTWFERPRCLTSAGPGE